MALYSWVKDFHIFTVILSITLFILRFFWKRAGSAMMQKRWVKILPHMNDTFLLLSGVSLLVILHWNPFITPVAWLTEKLVGVVIYIALGFIALSNKPRSQKTRWVAFILALSCLYLVIRLAMTKIPLLMG